MATPLTTIIDGLKSSRRTWTVTFSIRVGGLRDDYTYETEAWDLFSAYETAKTKCLEHCTQLYKQFDIVEVVINDDR